MTYSETTINNPFLKTLECCGENSEVRQPVEKLYYQGKIPSKRPKVVAIVGARHSTKYGEAIAYRAAYMLAKHGVIIVSGMAYGIDACAHRGCLDAGGITIAVLGTPIDRLYPRCNLSLAEEILKKGAIISEYAPGAVTAAYNFQVRNRIVSGLADAVLIVEASKESGTHGTYEFAVKQGKDIFVVPGDLSRPMSEGTNEMLREGAFPFLEPTDILLRLGYHAELSDHDKIKSLPPLMKKVYNAIANGVCEADAIIEELDISVTEFNCAITALECGDYVAPDGAGWTVC